MLEEKTKFRADGRIEFDPNNQESIDAAIKQVVAISELYGYQKGVIGKERKSYWKGFVDGGIICATAIGLGALLISWVLKKKRGN